MCFTGLERSRQADARALPPAHPLLTPVPSSARRARNPSHFNSGRVSSGRVSSAQEWGKWVRMGQVGDLAVIPQGCSAGSTLQRSS